MPARQITGQPNHRPHFCRHLAHVESGPGGAFGASKRTPFCPSGFAHPAEPKFGLETKPSSDLRTPAQAFSIEPSASTSPQDILYASLRRALDRLLNIRSSKADHCCVSRFHDNCKLLFIHASTTATVAEVTSQILLAPQLLVRHPTEHLAVRGWQPNKAASSTDAISGFDHGHPFQLFAGQ